ncbi:hypothetical protein DRO03_03170 [Methanosarcinales archaeon]|nr:MAG: hypothetical protein DRO03_03170 [Methanosarcinales archaeon]
MSCMADINFISLVPKYGKLKEQFANPKKVYLIDTGLINAIALEFSSDIGRLYENIVFIELKRREKEIYYWKNKHECDFLVKDGEEVEEVIQVCYDLTEENREQEINGITEAMDEFRLGRGLVITGDLGGEEEISCGTISYKPLWKWLLD